MSYVLHFYRMTYKTYDMQEYIFVHPEEWYSMSPILRDLFVSSFGHSEKRVVPWRLCASSHLGEPPQCFSIVLDFIQTIWRTLGKHDQLGIANKTRRQPITATLGKLYVVALFISPHSSRTCISPTSPSFCTPHDS